MSRKMTDAQVEAAAKELMPDWNNLSQSWKEFWSKRIRTTLAAAQAEDATETLARAYLKRKLGDDYIGEGVIGDDLMDAIDTALRPPAAQAGASKPTFDSNNMNWNYGYEKGFAAGIEAACGEVSSYWLRERIRALRPPTASSKRPVAWRVAWKVLEGEIDGWVVFQDERAAYTMHERTGHPMQGLYVRDGTP